MYAENPARNFLPSTGTLHYLRTPAAVQFSCGDGAQPAAVRIDSGIREHDTISPYYDPMIAKLIVWGQDRAQALARMAQALREFEVVGLHTNLAFLERLVTSVPFSSADLDTGLIERHQDSLFAPFPALPIAAVALAAAALLAREAEQQNAAAAPADPYSPWQALRGWRINGAYARSLSWLDAADQAEDKTALQASVVRDGATTRLEYAGTSVPFTWARGAQAHTLVVTLGEARESGRVFVQDDDFTVFYQGRATTLQWQDPLSHALGDEHGEGKLTAPMPGKVIAILAQPGSLVEKGAPLLVMEAMKMEHTISAPSAGTVEQILFAVGDQVQEGAQLLAFSPAALALQD